MTDLEVFLPRIMPYVPGCPEPTAMAGIIRAAQLFCERTRLWRAEDQFNVTPDSYNIACAPAGADLYEVEHASLDGNTLRPTSIGDLDYQRDGWRSEESGVAQWFTQTELGSVTLVPPTTGSLKLSMFLRPSEDAEQLPDFLAQLYRQEIADGALAEILMTPGQSFTDPSRAGFYAQRFEARLLELCSKNIKGQQRAKLRTRPQFF